jgi:hypothetical protein
MPPRGVKSPKRKRQYAKRIAAATTNKTRRRKGETKS